MIDPELERRTADCTELMDAWKMFLDMANKALKPPKTVTPDLEQRFLEIKARIAMLHDAFMDSLRHDRQIGQNMIDIVNRAITLRILAKISEAEIKKLELEWHECFLLLNETVTGLTEERERIAQINEFSHNMGKMREIVFLNIKSTLGSIYFKLIAIPAVIIFIFWGIQAFGIYNYDKLRDVRQLKGVVNTYLNVKRSLGMEGAYYDMVEFQAKMPPADREIRDVRSREDITSSNSQDQVLRKLTFLDQDARDTLGRAGGYQLMNYRTAGDRSSAFLYIFWFRNSADARSLEAWAKANASRIPSDYQVYRQVNVILLLQSRDKTLMENIKADVIDKL